MQMSSGSPDNETARYLAAYILENINWDVAGPAVGQESLTKLIKEFYDTLP